MSNLHNQPLAAPGLTSYRCKGRYGFIMIGALHDADALNEARRSRPDAVLDELEVWNGSQYVAVSRRGAEKPLHASNLPAVVSPAGCA